MAEEMDFEKVYRFKNQLEGTALKLSNYNMLNNLSQAGTTDAVAFSYAPKSGVVVYGIDGYEMLKPSAVTKDCFDESKYTAVQLEANQLVSQADTAYKLLDNENWSIVIPVDAARAAELEADAEAGVLRFSGSITDMVDADAELGNIVLNLSQSEDDFDYEIDSDLGNVEFDGVSMENFVICNKASGKMKLDSSMGNIEIYFEQD